MQPDFLYDIALTLVPSIGPVQARILLEYFNTAENIFKAPKSKLSLIEGIGEIRAKAIKQFEDFTIAEKQIAFCEKYNIQILSSKDATRYPQKLLQCYDAPTILYFSGNCLLNGRKTISIIGTRNNSDYGKQITHDLIEQLKDEEILVISGLAYGIDTIAHKAAVLQQLPTVGVLAHGLDSIYPAQNKQLAKEMLQNGGLLTEFIEGTPPDKFNFPKRNRIVAGMADATIVIETPIKGGSMITAELANNYNKDVFAFPGKTSDTKSAGCNYLIKRNKAQLITSANDIIESMGWQKKPLKKQVARTLFITLTTDEETIIQLLQSKDAMSIDEINVRSGLTSSSIAAALLNLELQNIIQSQPGKMYKYL